MRSVFRKLPSLLALACLTSTLFGGAAPLLAAADESPLSSVVEGYARAWLAGDREGVLDAFSENAVLLPPHHDPVVGIAAIRRFFWPPDAPPSRVSDFRFSPREATDAGKTGEVWGTFTLSFENGSGGTSQVSTYAGNFLMVLAKQPDGTWKVVRYIWNSTLQGT